MDLTQKPELMDAPEAGVFDAAPSQEQVGATVVMTQPELFAAVASSTGVSHPLDPLGIKATTPETEEGRAAMDALLDSLEKEIQALPLEDGVTRSDELPTVEVQSPLGSILMGGKVYDVCPPVNAATSAQEPLYLLIEKTVGVSLRDAEKLLVFDWGLQHLKDRAPFNSNDGKRVLALIQAVL